MSRIFINPFKAKNELISWFHHTVLLASVACCLSRGIGWSFRAFTSIRAMRLFLRAQAMIKFVLGVASTLEKQRALQGDLNRCSPTLWMLHEKKLKATRHPNPSMRAVAKLLWARASENSYLFAGNLSKSQILILRARMGPFDTLLFGHKIICCACNLNRRI